MRWERVCLEGEVYFVFCFFYFVIPQLACGCVFGCVSMHFCHTHVAPWHLFCCRKNTGCLLFIVAEVVVFWAFFKAKHFVLILMRAASEHGSILNKKKWSYAEVYLHFHVGRKISALTAWHLFKIFQTCLTLWWGISLQAGELEWKYKCSCHTLGLLLTYINHFTNISLLTINGTSNQR